MTADFQEISHSGGKVTFKTVTGEDGLRHYQVEYSSSRPVPMVLTAVYALPQGIPVGPIHLGGIGDRWNPPPIAGCFPVFITSDSTGHFGHLCPICTGYWRSGAAPQRCPYCGAANAAHNFLSNAQRLYVQHYCAILSDALDADADGVATINMDEIADATEKGRERPGFYVSEQSQQRKFTCPSCGEFNDILGRFGFCSECGTYNGLADFEGETLRGIRERLTAGALPEDCLRDAISGFDSLVGQYAKKIVALVPMTERRRTRLIRQRFHNLKDTRAVLRDWFDIDIGSGMKDDDLAFLDRMFFRRHVYEHNGGEVDQKYIDDSKDTTVQLKQHIHETQEIVHQVLGALVRLVRNLHRGFHELFPPFDGPIKSFEERKARIARYSGGQ